MQRPCTPSEFPFLDLRYPAPIEYLGRTFPSAENAYQSTRFADPETAEKFRYMTPSTAAYKGAAWRTTVQDWDNMKRDFLYDVLSARFNDPYYANLLKSTGTRPILMANYRHENDLGACQCKKCHNKGCNAMGKILEQIRTSLS